MKFEKQNLVDMVNAYSPELSGLEIVAKAEVDTAWQKRRRTMFIFRPLGDTRMYKLEVEYEYYEGYDLDGIGCECPEVEPREVTITEYRTVIKETLPEAVAEEQLKL